MVVTFNEDYLENLYTRGVTGTKKIRFQPQIVRGYQKGLKYLIQAKRKEDLFPFKSLHFEALHGDKEGRFSIKANDQYRIEFTLTETDEEPVVADDREITMWQYTGKGSISGISGYVDKSRFMGNHNLREIRFRH